MLIHALLHPLAARLLPAQVAAILAAYLRGASPVAARRAHRSPAPYQAWRRAPSRQLGERLNPKVPPANAAELASILWWSRYITPDLVARHQARIQQVRNIEARDCGLLVIVGPVAF